MFTLISICTLVIAQPQAPPASNTSQQEQAGRFGTMFQMPVDGTYQILAYEKFGQVLPGMNTVKVVIRNNILIFPGDGKFPGKMIQLAFGPGNTIMMTPLDGRTTPWQSSQGKQPLGDSLPPQGGTGGINTVNNPQGDATQSGYVMPSANSEIGVYVLSTEYFSISVTGKQAVVDQMQQTRSGTPADRNLPPGAPPLPPAKTQGAGGNLPGGTPPTGQTGFNFVPPIPPTRGASQAVLVLKRVAN